MAGLADIVRSGVATAHRIVSTLEGPVQHFAWTGVGAYAAPTYASAVIRPAIISLEQKLRRLPGNVEVNQRASFILLVPVTNNGASGRREPVDPRDKFILPDGTTGPVLYAGGPLDPKTNNPFLIEVVLG